jgi:heterodisulfide reductase subunit A
VLSSAVIPRENEQLAKMLKVPLSEGGFFLEAHAKLRPVDFATDGIFLCGMAHFPKTIDETISQAAAAAARASIVISHDVITVVPIVSTVDQKICVGCGLCESLCPYNAIRLEPWPEGGEKAFTISASCKGCGVCAASCPQHAIKMNHFTDSEISSQIGALTVMR